MRMQKERRPELHALDKVKSSKFSGPRHRRQKGSITPILIASDSLLLPSLEVIMPFSPGSQIS